MAPALTVDVEYAMKLTEDSSVVKNRGNNMKKQRKSFKSLSLPRFGCLRLDDESKTVNRKNQNDGSIDTLSAAGVVDDFDHNRRLPTHLIIMVNGIIGSAEDWRYAAKQFLKAYPQEVIVHCSERNTSTLTFDGIDVMGERLADEVISVIQRYPHLRKISFIGHSLGGMVARYAIALLYGENYLNRLSKVHGETGSNGCEKVLHEEDYIGKIAGLEPVNFITFATPHLGSRGHNQMICNDGAFFEIAEVMHKLKLTILKGTMENRRNKWASFIVEIPMFCGFHTLEIIGRQTSWFLGRTGRHLYLTDKDKDKPPLLLRMANDCEGLPFISALKSFNRRVAYANMRFDQLVGWCTSSIRLENELPKRRHILRNDKYRHIANVETGVVSYTQRASTIESIMMNGFLLRSLLNIHPFRSDFADMLEEMIKGLTAVSWERVDVKFGGGKNRLVAHNSIQVQHYWMHSSGADVIKHMIDNFVL